MNEEGRPMGWDWRGGGGVWDTSRRSNAYEKQDTGRGGSSNACIGSATSHTTNPALA